jgi:hypothetical protein
VNTTKTKRPTLAFVLFLAAGFALYFLMQSIQPLLPHILFDYETWDAGRTDSAFWRLLWLIGDGTEPHFHKTILGGLGLIGGSWLAYYLDRKQSKLRGTPVGYGSGTLWPWVFAASLLSLAIAVAVFGGLHVDGDTYVSTYVCYVSIAGAVIFLYGGSIPTLLTGAILGAFTSVPISIWMRNCVCLPNGFPGVLATVTGMWLGGIATFEICRHMPWMQAAKARNTQAIPSQPISGEMSIEEYKHKHPVGFLFRRILCDVSEPVFVANEWAGGLLLVGSMLTWILNPLQPYYGNGFFPALILCQVLTAGFSMWFYWDSWMENDFVPTFVPLVSTAPACILQFGATMPVIIISSLIGALMGPALATWINEKIPEHWHVMIGLTFSMFLTSGIAVVMIRYLGMCIPGIY